jgi:hypothetical protein
LGEHAAQEVRLGHAGRQAEEGERKAQRLGEVLGQRGLPAPRRPHHEEVAVPFLGGQPQERRELGVDPPFERHLAAIVQVDFEGPRQPGLGDLFVHDPLDFRLVQGALQFKVRLDRPGEPLEQLVVLLTALRSRRTLGFRHGRLLPVSGPTGAASAASAIPESARPHPVFGSPILILI